MSWIQTFTGGRFSYTEPTASSPVLEDIAHALAGICRFNGHTKQHYSVAEHSVHVMRCVAERAERFIRNDYARRKLVSAALMHDAAEAYLTDPPSPLKPFFGDHFRRLDDTVQRHIEETFDLPPLHILTVVKEADRAVLAAEARQVFDEPRPEWLEALPNPWDRCVVQFWPRELAKARFLHHARELGIGAAS